jgi:glucokinase
MTQALALGIDIGGTNTSYGIVNRDGRILAKGKMRTAGHERVEEFVTALCAQMQPLINESGADNLAGAGIGAPNGNYFTGEIAFAPNLPWHGVIPLARLFSDALGIPTTLTNDANAAAIGEMAYGAAKGMNDFLVVTLGTGVGSGFVSNGKVIYGNDGFAGELGHVIAVRDGRVCGCGRKGCLEAYCSATGLVYTANEWLAQRSDNTVLRDIAGEVAAHTIQDAAMQGDEFALEIYDYTARILGQTLADIVAITSPEAIIFFGGVARAGALLLTPTQRYMEENMLNIFKDKVRFLPSALPDADAAILGASALVW